ncbi:MAG TPA: GDSL-type esterase/lipase family protein, partial [Gammaproteobacteria bacterium]|nr:GDSL-type esterase/lipase family protein [Gammaproteobacteria bacterium]
MRFHTLPFVIAALIGALLQPRFAFAQNPFEAEIEAYEAQDLINPPPLGSVVVTGSSSIAKWTTIQTDLAPLDVIARGFGGSSTDDLDYFLDRIVLKYQPRAVVIYEGENDITVNGQTPTHVATNMAGILARISAALPNTRVYVISIKATPAHIQYWAGWESWANQLLAALCATDARYTYIDVASHLIDSGGTPIPQYFQDDGVHLTTLGYQVWTSIIRPVLLPQQLIPLPPDSLPPTTPTGLTAVAQSSSRIDINWNGASDSGSGLAGYSVFRNGTQIASTTSITYSDTGLSSNTLYTYTVTAFDRMSPNRNESTPSAPASATTQTTSTPTPTVSLQVNPSAVPIGGTTQLTWSSTNATSCTASGSWAGAKATSGSATSSTLSVNTSFTLTCTGAGGTASDTKAVAVDPAATVSLTVSPASVPSGGTTQLTWTSSNATSCTASGGWSGTKTTEGSASSNALSATTTFTLTCTGPAGSGSDSKTVTVVGAPTVSLSASPAGVTSGATAQLSWTSTNATTCTASGGWSGSKATSGSATSSALSATTMFMLTCTGTGGSASDSKTVVVGSLPAGTWGNNDIGAVGAVGSSTQATQSDGTLSATVNGSGNDIWDAADAFQFDFESLTGDGTITARVVSETNTDPWAKSGVMIRETLSASSTHAFVAVTVGNGVAFQRRTSTGALSLHTYGPTVTAPYWVRLNRSGSTFSAYSSPDGTTWTLIGQSTINMAASVYIGLAVTAHHAGLINTTAFDHVLISSGGAPPAPTVGLTATPASVASGATTQLSWTSTNATSCTASGGWSGSQPTSGSATSAAITAPTTFTLTCTGAGGSASDSKTVTLIGAPTVSLSVSPASVTTGGTTQLTWTSTNATSCTASGGWSGSKATSGAATSSALSVTTTFTLTCTGTGGSGSDSKTVTVGASAGSWSNQDIGSTGAAGSSTNVTSSDGTVTATVNGSGADIWDVADAFQFDYQTLTGDGTITARVVSETNTDPWAKAGVMIRETLSSSSTHAFVAVTVGNGVAFQRRTSTGAQSLHTYGPAVAAPYWVRLTRSGSTFSAYSSPDGTTWALIGQTTITMANSVYIGLAVTAHLQGALNTTNFDHVTTGSAGSPSAPTVSLTATPASVASGATTQLSWTSTNATSCTASGGWSGSQPTSGSATSAAITTTTTFTLTCAGAGGSGSDSKTVAIIGAPTVSLTATPMTVTSGATTQLTWTSTNATSCTASGGWSGSQPT